MASSPLPGARPPDRDHLAWLQEHAVLGPTGWQDKAVLDLGCGSGFLCAEAVRLGAAHAVGVDLKAPDVSVAGWKFLSVDLEAATWPEDVPRASAQRRGFELICAFDIIEHLSSPVSFLTACRTLLAPGGHLVLTTPNTASWERFVRGARWSGATDPQHKILFNRYSLSFLLDRVGFRSEVMRAPVRRLARAHLPCPQVGAQIFCVASRS